MSRRGDRQPFLERVMKFITAADSGCWEWTGYLEKGYGVTHYYENGAEKHKYMGAHRAMYLELRGPIPHGLYIDHLCRNPACVNPMHLEPVTMVENFRRSPLTLMVINSKKTHCPAGHKYSQENLCSYFLRRGARRCKICDNARRRKLHKLEQTRATPC